jgi:hypothetical protein
VKSSSLNDLERRAWIAAVVFFPLVAANVWFAAGTHPFGPRYDVEALKKRGRGRPGRGAEPSQVVALRLTSDELAALDARAAREHKTRSELIRDALAAYGA